MFKKIAIMATVVAALVYAADTYTLSLVKDGGQGSVTFPTTTSLKFISMPVERANVVPAVFD